MLAAAGINQHNLAEKDRTEVAQVLGVDAGIQTRSRMDKTHVGWNGRCNGLLPGA